MESALVVDDSQDWRETVSAILSDNGYHTEVASNPYEAFEILKNDSFDLLICDLHMPFRTDGEFFDYPYSYEVGVRTIKELEWVFPQMKIIAISATVPWELSKIMAEIAHIPAIPKPFSRRDLLEVIGRLSTQHSSLGLN